MIRMTKVRRSRCEYMHSCIMIFVYTSIFRTDHLVKAHNARHQEQWLDW